MKLPRAVILIGALAAVAIVTVSFSALLVPWLIDSRLIRDKISSEFAKKSGVSVSFGKIALLWLPRPTVVLDNAEISFGDETYGSIRTVKIYPAVYYLLIGRVVVRRALLQEPRLRIRLPERSRTRFDLEEWEEQIRSALVRLTKESPTPHIELSGGSAEIGSGDKPPMLLEDVAAQAVASPEQVQFAISARSNLWQGLRVAGSISPESLQAQLEIGLEQFKIRETLSLLAPQIAQYAQQGEASLAVKIASVGLRNVKASVGGSIGQFVFVRNSGSAKVDAQRLKAGITYEGGVLHVDVEQLDFGSPRLKASGTLKFHSGLLSARVRVRDVDITEVGDLARRLFDDNEAVKSVLRTIPAGRIAEMNFQSAGRSFAEMSLSENIALSGTMRGCKIWVPGYDLQLTAVAGSVRIAHGILEADKLTANVGTAKGWNGKLRLGLQGKTAPFHLDISASAAAAELQSLLLKVVHDETVRGELLKLRNISGALSGRLILGESLGALSPAVTISKAEISAMYAPVPFPIEIRSARFSYAQGVTRLENAQGSLGRSIFEGLGGTVEHDGTRQIKVESTRVSVDLQEVATVLRSFNDLRLRFAEFHSARGQIELEKLTLAGAYDDPAAWIFTSAGTFHQLEITHPYFPGPVAVTRGKFAANHEKVDLSDTAIAIADASWVGGATFEYLKEAPRLFVTNGMGTIGAEMTQWLSHYVEWPEELKLLAPLKIAAERLTWRSGGNISFHGQVTAAGGPRLSLLAMKNPQGLAVQDLTIDDGGRRARVTFQLAKNQLDLSFKGELTQQTIDKIFASFPTQDSALSGVIQLSASLERPMRVSAQGQLAGSNLWLPLGTEKALLEKFNIEASGESLLVRSVDLRWGQSRIALSGKVTRGQELLRVDVDVTGDQLDWEELRRFFVSGDKQRQQETVGAVSFPAVEGTIHLKTDRFTFERFNVTSLETTAAISGSGIKAEIHRGMACGINVTGSVDVVGNEIGIDLQLATTSAQFEPTTVCLTNRQNNVTGTYSLTAHVLARGERDQLLRALQGNFELNAQDGEFIRSPGIDATFDYLNTTGDFKLAFPDLDRQTFPYRLVTIKGRMDGEILVGDEVTVQSSRLNLSGHGRVNLKEKRIDAKALVAVLQPVDEVISRIPVIGSMWGGSLVGIPVRITGSLEHPDVTYLSPADVGVELLNIPLRILGIPLGAMRLFTPGGDWSDKQALP
jgi:hypothetical protein